MNHLTIEQILFIHDRLIEETGGSHGLRDLDGLLAATERPHAGTAESEFYPSLHDKAAVLMESIVRNHAFIDGNKRTGLTAAGMLLALNGWEIRVSQREAFTFTMRIAYDQPDDPRPNWREISEWLKEHSQQSHA
ncbi:MAG: type II toxin-antitoxin system death-on-curing family toxin [Nitrolancea sp.]